MEFPKKRKTEENGNNDSPSSSASITTLSPEDVRKILQPFSQDQLLELLQSAALRFPDVLEVIRSVADRDSTFRKLFVRGLAGETTTDTLRCVFSSFGELDEAIVIFDKSTGKSKGYGFVKFRHVDGAILALKEPSKKIDGRMTVTQYAAAGLSGGPGTNGPAAAAAAAVSDVSARKIFVGNVPFDITSEKLLSHFLMYGEIEEGPLGFDKGSGKSKGFAFFVYKTEEGARASLVEPTKTIDGHQVVCKLAVDNKKGKPGGFQNQTPSGFTGDGMAAQQQQPLPGPVMGSQYRYPAPGTLPGNNYALQGGAGYTSQLPSSYVPGGAYTGSQFGGPTAGDNSGRLPPSSAGFAYGSAYGLNSSALPSQQHQQSRPMPRLAPGGMYQGMPSYY